MLKIAGQATDLRFRHILQREMVTLSLALPGICIQGGRACWASVLLWVMEWKGAQRMWSSFFSASY